MDVSIVVPTRNRSALLSRAVHSALRQHDVGVEVLVVDEASTDDTQAVLERIADVRVRVIRHETPRGVSAARNSGAARARGDWLAFLDDDDLWAPTKLARQVEAATALGRGWAYAGSVNISVRGRIVSGRPPLPAEVVMATLPRCNCIPGGGSNVVARREVWEGAGPFDTRLRNTEDWEMWIRLARAGPPACVPSPLVAYCVHDSNSSLDVAEIERGTRLIETLHHTRVDWGRLHRWMAESCLRRGQRRAALGQFARAAVRGQAWGAAGDMAAILARHLRRTGGVETATTDPWLAEAARWLQEEPAER